MIVIAYVILCVWGLILGVLAHIGDGSPIDETPGTSIIDLLSSRAEFSYFLRHVQRSGLVPLVNSLRNVTIFAPVNLAFAGSGDDLSYDTPESLLRYFVNLPLRVAKLDRSQAVFDTLYQLLSRSNYTLAVVPDLKLGEYIIDGVSTAIDSDIFAKHQLSFIQPVDHLLPIKPTLCQWLQSDSISYRHPNVSWTLQLMELVIKARESSPIVGKRLTCAEFMKNSRSLFIPTDSLVALTLLSLESSYYTSLYRYMNSTEFDTTWSALNEFHADVLALVSGLRASLLVFGLNGTSDTLKARYSIDPSTRNLVVDHSLYVNQSISFADGVIHVLDDQAHIDPFGTLGAPIIEMNPRKALYALHYTNFVSEIQFRKLEYLIDGSTHNQTIFVEVEERDDKSDDEGRVLAFSNRQSLLYHFADIALPCLDDAKQSKHLLVDSKLCSKRRLGGCFSLKLSHSSSHGRSVTTINDDGKLESGSVYAGNNTYVYFTDAELAAPSSFKHALGDLISSGGVPRHLESIVIDQDSCLLTIKLLNQFDLLSLDNNGMGYTAFLPCGLGVKSSGQNHWDSLGLVLEHLKRNPREFKKVLKALIVEGTVYSDYGVHTPQLLTSMRNLNGAWVRVEHEKLSRDDRNLITLNDTSVSVPLNSDVLFSQGVLHVVDHILLFDNLEISFLDLMETTVVKKDVGKSLLSIIESIPHLRDRVGLGINTTLEISLLVPTTESLVDQNITANFHRLSDFFDFHSLNRLEAFKLTQCINGPRMSSSVNTSTIIGTNLRKESLNCIHDSHSKRTWLQLVMPQHLADSVSVLSLYNKDHEIELLSYGCARQPNLKDEDAQCVFLIKKPLNLAWLETNSGHDFLHINLGFLSIGVGIILGLMVAAFIVAAVVYVLLRRERYASRDAPKRLPVFEPHPRSNFMSVRLEEEDEGYMIDHGYETDIEGARHEWDSLLAGNTPRKSARQYGYGAVSSNGRPFVPENGNGDTIYSTGAPTPTVTLTRPVQDAVTSPRYIEGANLTKGLARDRNLPGF